MNWKIVCILGALSLALNGTVFAAGAETYQITGTVVEATGSKVTVEKGTARFEFDIDPATMKGSAELKVGSTVTVTYVMSATKIEAASQAPSSQCSPCGEAERRPREKNTPNAESLRQQAVNIHLPTSDSD